MPKHVDIPKELRELRDLATQGCRELENYEVGHALKAAQDHLTRLALVKIPAIANRMDEIVDYLEELSEYGGFNNDCQVQADECKRILAMLRGEE